MTKGKQQNQPPKGDPKGDPKPPKPPKPPKQPKNVRAPKPKHRWVENGSVGEWVSLPFQAETTVVTATERAQGKTKHERPKQLESQEPKNERTRPV